jgi:hypothetical protein
MWAAAARDPRPGKCGWCFAAHIARVAKGRRDKARREREKSERLAAAVLPDEPQPTRRCGRIRRRRC